MVIPKFIQKNKQLLKLLVPVVLVVFFIRFLFSFFPPFGVDMWTWLGWADRLSSFGFAKFYTDQSWTQYTPGYLYWLWAIGKLGWMNEFAIKVPVILFDIATGLLIFSLVRKVSKKLATVSLILYTLSPVVIFDGSVWGQIDGLVTFFLFLSAYLLIEKKNIILSIFVWSIAFLIKPQAIAILPVFILVILLKKFKWREILFGGLLGTLFLFIGSVLFFPNNSVFGLPQLVLKMADYYALTSVNAFNIWGWVGMWESDAKKFLGVALSSWGTIFLILSTTISLFVYRNKLNIKANYYLLFAVLCLCFFLFPTRVHERYLFPFFAFLLTAASLSRSKGLFAIFGITTIANFLNLYYPYVYYNHNFLKIEFLYNISRDLAKPIGALFLIIFFTLLFWDKIGKKIDTLIKQMITGWKRRNKINNSVAIKFSKSKLSSQKTKLILIGILIFAFATRVFDLSYPTKEYFDEVYHAFTAKVILHDDAKAWEWWNNPPAGFAYEWTHPPLAKLGMTLGMMMFGENAFGWRIPGALLGVGSVFLVYLLAKEIFKDELIGLLSAGVFSLDGLMLVMSRIGMNDSYLLFFSLLSLYFFIKNKNLPSAITFGLALASKWSAIWILPIFFILWLRRKNKSEFSLLWFLILPFAIYLLTYIPMFLTGHGISVWWEMQKQMWWYHTGLRATHPYSSSWWTWPFLIRPIYLYTSDEIGGWVSRIYAFGNPIVFWFGLSSIALSAVYAYIEKNKNLGFIVFSYLIFFAPWAASPRIMFLYHYTPSIPFLAIATGYILRKFPKMILIYFAICGIAFVYFFPHYIGFNIPVWLDQSYYWVNSWR